LAVPGSKATGEISKRIAVRIADLDVLTHEWSPASFVGSANSRPAGTAFTVIGWTKIASGLGLKASVEYHWLVGAARLSMASVR
jgi:hypothetical protein